MTYRHFQRAQTLCALLARLGGLAAMALAAGDGLAQAPNKPAVADKPPSLVVIVPQGEPGDPLVVSGVVYGQDGSSPLADVSIEVHQTGEDGRYHRNLLTRRARIQATLRTDSQGRYQFRTIRPGSYPGERIPAHIHFKVWRAGYPEQNPPDLLFEGDPKLVPGVQGEQIRKGQFANVCSPQRDSAGVLHCTYNIRLRP